MSNMRMQWIKKSRHNEKAICRLCAYDLLSVQFPRHPGDLLPHGNDAKTHDFYYIIFDSHPSPCYFQIDV